MLQHKNRRHEPPVFSYEHLMASPAVLAFTAAGKGFALLFILYHAPDNKKQSNQKQDQYNCRTHNSSSFQWTNHGMYF